MFFYQFVHSSESILGVPKNFHSIYPSNVCTHFFQKLVMISEFFLQIKVGFYLFSRACYFLARQLLFLLFSFFLPSFSLFSFSSFFTFLSYLSFVHFLSLLSFFLFFSLKRSCGRGRTLPTYI